MILHLIEAIGLVLLGIFFLFMLYTLGLVLVYSWRAFKSEMKRGKKEGDETK